MTAIAFSGTTQIPDNKYGFVAKYVRRHMGRPGRNTFITGAANGVDTLCHYLCYAWDREAEHIMVVPNGNHNIEIVFFATAMDLEVIFMPEGTDYMDRNTKMIQLADVLVAFPPQGNEIIRGVEGAGTWSTIRRARKKGIPIYIYPLDNTKPWKENV